VSATLREQALAYLAGHNVMTLATTGPEGPWAAAVFYASEGFALYFLSSPASRHGRNLAARPAVAAAIQEDYRDWLRIKGIQLEGEAHVLEGEPRERAAALYAAKFPVVGPDAPAEIARALSRVQWYRLAPARLLFIDNSRGLGHREEVSLQDRASRPE
jgi:uncharacterized protein YhbP (UPF0306 family)